MTTVETERLRLRGWAADDLDALAAIFAEPAFWHHPFGRGLSRDETERFIDRQLDGWATQGFGLWAAELREEGVLIGFIGLTVPQWLPEVLPAVEVGWRLHPAHWGRGLATEGGRASLEYGFEALGLDRIISIFTPANVASGRVMDKLGMTPFLTTTDPERDIPLEVRAITRGVWLRRSQ